MDIKADSEQITLRMSHAEWAALRSRDSILRRHGVDFSNQTVSNEPEGRTFGKGHLDEGNELEVLKNRLKRLEAKTESEAFEDNARIKDLGERVSSLETEGHLCEHASITHLAERITALEERVEARTLVDSPADWSRVSQIESKMDRYDKSTTHVSAAQAALRERMDWIQQTQAEVQDGIERRLASIENELTGVLSESKPVDMVHTEAEIEAVKKLSRVNLEAMSATELEAVKKDFMPSEIDPYTLTDRTMHYLSDRATLAAAESRIRKYMTSFFSETTICGVVNALYGPNANRTEVLKTDPVKITDHVFQAMGPDRRHCSYRKGSQGEKCGRTLFQHSQP